MPKNKLKPIRVFYSDLSERFYAARAWREVKTDNDQVIVEITGEKFDVTDDIARIIETRGVIFTKLTTDNCSLTTGAKRP